MNVDLNQQFTDMMQKHPDQIEGYLDLIFIARNVERIGDHATNIAEDAVYVKAAQDIRHAYSAVG